MITYQKLIVLVFSFQNLASKSLANRSDITQKLYPVKKLDVENTSKPYLKLISGKWPNKVLIFKSFSSNQNYIMVLT